MQAIHGWMDLFCGHTCYVWQQGCHSHFTKQGIDLALPCASLACPCSLKSSLSLGISYWLSNSHSYILCWLFSDCTCFLVASQSFSINLNSLSENDLGEGNIFALSEGLPCFEHLQKVEWVPGREWLALVVFPTDSDTSTLCCFSLPTPSAWNSVESLTMPQNHFLTASNNAFPWRR